jgi:hypothetical protein
MTQPYDRFAPAISNLSELLIRLDNDRGLRCELIMFYNKQ